MSNSFKKNPGHYATIINHGVRKKEKKIYNRKWRRVNKHKIINQKDILLDKKIEVCDVWSLVQDGKYRIMDKEDNLYEKYKRK